jgi:hypothetical protein
LQYCFSYLHFIYFWLYTVSTLNQWQCRWKFINV